MSTTTSKTARASNDDISILCGSAWSGWSNNPSLTDKIAQFWIDREPEFQAILNKTIVSEANAILLKDLLSACNFYFVNDRITPGRFSVLDALEEKPFMPIIYAAGTPVTTDEIRKMFADKPGTTSQFLSYIRDNPHAGLNSNLVHLASEITLGEDKKTYCLCVTNLFGNKKKRALHLASFDDIWDEDYVFFGARIIEV